MKRRYASSAKRVLPVRSARPFIVSSFRPRLRIVSIMPGIDARAPERTLTRSGALGIAEAHAELLLDARERLVDRRRELSRDLPVVRERAAGVGRDGETGRDRQPERGHLRESCALAPEQVPARRISLCFAFAERENELHFGAHSTRVSGLGARVRAARLQRGIRIFCQEREEQLFFGVVERPRRRCSASAASCSSPRRDVIDATERESAARSDDRRWRRDASARHCFFTRDGEELARVRPGAAERSREHTWGSGDEAASPSMRSQGEELRQRELHQVLHRRPRSAGAMRPRGARAGRGGRARGVECQGVQCHGEQASAWTGAGEGLSQRGSMLRSLTLSRNARKYGASMMRQEPKLSAPWGEPFPSAGLRRGCVRSRGAWSAACAVRRVLVSPSAAPSTVRSRASATRAASCAPGGTGRRASRTAAPERWPRAAPRSRRGPSRGRPRSDSGDRGFARARAARWPRAAPAPRRRRVRTSGIAPTCTARTVSTSDSRWKSRRIVQSSQSVVPRPKMSARRSSGSCMICSGARYESLPFTTPGAVLAVVRIIVLAMPKSKSLMAPSNVTNTFAGFTSRWMSATGLPASSTSSWACCKPSAMRAPIHATSSGSSRRFRVTHVS